MARAQVELIEIPQRLGGSRKNAADIKMAVDAIELAYERGFITTFAIGTGDSDFTPLVHKLRELDKRVIGIGVQSSTSALLPPACDEFLFYDRLPGVEPAGRRRGAAAARTARRGRPSRPVDRARASGRSAVRPAGRRAGRAGAATGDEPTSACSSPDARRPAAHADGPVLRLDAQAGDPAQGPDLRRGRPRLPGLRRAAAQPRGAAASWSCARAAPRAIPRSRFPEDDVGRRRRVRAARGRRAACWLRRPPQLSGLKNQLRKREPDFSEKRYGFNSFLSFGKAARARGPAGDGLGRRRSATTCLHVI